MIGRSSAIPADPWARREQEHGIGVSERVRAVRLDTAECIVRYCRTELRGSSSLSHIDRDAERVEQAPFGGDSGPRGVERRPVVDSGPDDQQSNRHIEAGDGLAATESQHLDWDMALIVVHREHAVELPLCCADAHRVREPGADRVSPLGRGHSTAGLASVAPVSPSRRRSRGFSPATPTVERMML